MSTFIQLTYRAKRSLSQNPNRLPYKVVLPKLNSVVRNQSQITQSRIESPKQMFKSPKILPKILNHEFFNLKLSCCSNKQDQKQKNNISQMLSKIQSQDTQLRGFENPDGDFDSFSLESYLQRQ